MANKFLLVLKFLLNLGDGCLILFVAGTVGLSQFSNLLITLFTTSLGFLPRIFMSLKLLPFRHLLAHPGFLELAHRGFNRTLGLDSRFALVVKWVGHGLLSATSGKFL